MSRLALVDPAHATGRAQELFAGPLKGMHINLFKALAHSPAALDGYLALNGALTKGVLTAQEREAVALASAASNHCEYCAAAHTALGRKQGISESDTIAIRQGTPKDPRLAAIARLTRAIHEHRGDLPDREVEAFRGAGFGDAAIIEVFAHYALNVLTNYFNNFNKTPVDFPALPKA